MLDEVILTCIQAYEQVCYFPTEDYGMWHKILKYFFQVE